jgi:hypothetical protein
MNTPIRHAGALGKAAALAFAALTLAYAAPAQARLPDLGPSGPLSGGVFRGVPIRPQTVAARPNEVETGLVSSDCRTVKQSVRDRLGAITVRRVQICE